MNTHQISDYYDSSNIIHQTLTIWRLMPKSKPNSVIIGRCGTGYWIRVLTNSVNNIGDYNTDRFLLRGVRLIENGFFPTLDTKIEIKEY